MTKTAVASELHVVDRASDRLQPTTDNQKSENRRKRCTDKRNAGKRDGDPSSRLGATLLRECQIVQKDEVATRLVGSDRERANDETSPI